MKKAVVVAIGVAILAFAFIPSLTSAGTSVDKEKLAQRLVVECAKVIKGEIVHLSGGTAHIELLENMAVHVRKQGAFPLLTIGSDRLSRRMWDDVPAELDTQPPLLDLKLAEIVDVEIGINYSEDMQLLSHIPAERLNVVALTYAPVGDVYLSRNVRQIYLGNALNPTEERARLMGVTIDQLSEIYWSGVTVDPSILSTRASEVKATLAEGSRIRITNSNGTDLQLGIEGRPVFATEGQITDEDIKTGGAACQLWLPSGEVFLAPVPKTATGKVVVDRHIFQGQVIENLVLTFDNGRLTGMTAGSGLEPMEAFYNAAGEGKDMFSIVDIGINPNVQPLPGTDMIAWMASGMVTVGFGGNTWAGGDNKCPISIATFLPGSTLEVDGKAVVKEGVLLLSSD